ncbi:hypothetical protein Tco_0670231 [Tanacetum coccineum]
MFDELMSTPIDFTSFSINRLKLDMITRADLVGSVFKLLKGNSKRKYSSSVTKTPVARYTMKSIKDLISIVWSPFTIACNKDAALRISHRGPQRQRFYRAMINRVSKHEVFSTMRIMTVVSVQIQKKYGYGYLEEIFLRRADKKLYKFKEEGDVIVDFVTTLKMFTLRIIVQNRVEDVQLGVESYQRKLNLTKPQRTCPLISAKEPYTLNFKPSGVIYENKRKKKSLMRVDEVHKFCDETLQSILNILRQRLQNFRLGYNNDMPSRQ